MLFVAIIVRTEDLNHRNDARQRLRPATAMTAFLNSLFVSLLAPLTLAGAPDDPRPIYLIAISVLVMFSVGVDRDWEFIGAQTPGLGDGVPRGRAPPRRVIPRPRDRPSESKAIVMSRRFDPPVTAG